MKNKSFIPVIFVVTTIILTAIVVLKAQVTGYKHTAGLHTKINTDCVVERKTITPSWSNFVTGILREIR